MTDEEILDIPQGQHKTQFWNQLLQIILMLVGVHVLSSLLVAFSSLLMLHFLGNWEPQFGKYSSWIVQLAFGIILYGKLVNGNHRNAISIGLLAVFMPVFGGLFYLLTIALKSLKL